MKLQVVPLDFYQDGAEYKPADPALYQAVLEYCHANLAAIESTAQADRLIRSMKKAWAVISEGPRVHGVSVYRLRADIPVFRTTGEYGSRATVLLHDRMQAFFADNGCRGDEVFLFLSDKESEEQRCPEWQKNLELAGAQPACRFSVVVR